MFDAIAGKCSDGEFSLFDAAPLDSAPDLFR